MSDQNDRPDAAAGDDESHGPLAGERLAAARRELQIPVIEIAKELHLDEYKVRAMECNDFDVIGAPVFAKGHLRKYAQLVHVDEADVMADYYQLNRSTGAPPVISTRPKPRRVMAPGPWIAAIVVILLVLAAYWWFAVREVALERPVTGEVAPLPQNAVTIDEPEDIAEEVDDQFAVDQTRDLKPEPVEQVSASPEPFDMRLSITYSGDCWTEITDASGRSLFFDLGKAGSTVNLSGESPFNALFGDAANVNLVVNGATFNIPAADRRGRTARLTITGS